MPTYVYRIIRDPSDDRPEETFEIMQLMSDEPLKKHPETGEPVERVLCVPQVRRALGNSDLANAGFTKFVKNSDGTYRREVGSAGPKHINPHEA